MKPLQFVVVLIATLVANGSSAYPEGYPRVGNPSIIEPGDELWNNSLKLIPNPNRNEYVALWQGPPKVLKASILDGDTLEPRGEPFTLLDFTGEHPFQPGFVFSPISKFDMTWDSARNRYFLAAYLQSNHPDPSMGHGSETFAGYVNLEPTPIANLTVLPSCTPRQNGGGLRTIFVPGSSPGAGLVYLFQTFGPGIPPMAALRSGGTIPESGVCGMYINGYGSDGPTIVGQPATVMTLTDLVPENDLSAVYMTDLSAEFDPEFRHFVLASTVIEAKIEVEADVQQFWVESRSDVVTKVVGVGLSGDATALAKTSQQNHRYEEERDTTNFFPLMTARLPQLVMGPLTEDKSRREWLVTFIGMGPLKAMDFSWSVGRTESVLSLRIPLPLQPVWTGS